jgi:hypothetical protein
VRIGRGLRVRRHLAHARCELDAHCAPCRS